MDVEDQLPGTEATLKVYWNTLPYFGFLFDTQHKGELKVKIPAIGQSYQRS